MHNKFNKELGLPPSLRDWMTLSLQHCEEPFTCPQHQLLQIPKQMLNDHYNLQWNYDYHRHYKCNQSHGNDLPLQMRMKYGRDLCLQYYCLPSEFYAGTAKSFTLLTEQRRVTAATPELIQRNCCNKNCTNIT